MLATISEPTDANAFSSKMVGQASINILHRQPMLNPMLKKAKQATIGHSINA
jgi:hypothetical protein